ncbi:MAG TPA: hypothetical protein VGH80_03760 [Xanthomonadaceae bacterium]|jgi:hypothetical protein
MFYEFGPLAYVSVLVGVFVVLFLRYRRGAGMSSRPQRSLHVETIAAIESALRNGDTIEAISLYREWMGCSLDEAKAAIEVIARRIAAPP